MITLIGASHAGYQSVTQAQTAQQQLIKDKQRLNEQLAQTQRLTLELRTHNLTQQQQLNKLTAKLHSIEQQLSYNPSSNNLDHRLDELIIESNLRALLLTKIPNGSPVGKQRISSEFGVRIHPVTQRKTTHRGLDFAVNTGTKIYAPADGVVNMTRKSQQGSGNFLKLQHSFGFTSSYSHLKSFKVKHGQFVKKGDLIALSGNSGLSSGPHLHYEVRFADRALNPRPFINWSKANFNSLFTQERHVQWQTLLNMAKQELTAIRITPPAHKIIAQVTTQAH